MGCWLADLLEEQQQSTTPAALGGCRHLDMQALQQDLVDAAEPSRGTPGDTGEGVLHQAFAALVQRTYLALAQVNTALWYMDVGHDLWRQLARYLQGERVQGGGSVEQQLEEIVERSLAIAGEKRFLHWEIAFPSVFYDQRSGRSLGDQAGFDVVVGNPPYVRQEQLGEDKPFLAAHYDVAQGTADLFLSFFEQALRLLRTGGTLALLSSNMWLRTQSATKLRQYLRTHASFEQLLDPGNTRVFADAPDLCPAIQIARKGVRAHGNRARCAVFSRSDDPRAFCTQPGERRLFDVSIDDQPDSGWQLSSDASRRIVTHLLAQGQPPGEVTGHRMYRGVVTGFNDVFLVDRATRDRLIEADQSSAQVLKPVVRGQDLRPWYQEDEDRWLIFTCRGIDIQAYPAMQDYVQRFRTRLEPCPRAWTNRERWPGRRAGAYRWYELQDAVAYAGEFEQPKILWPDIAKYPRFSWDTRGLFCNDTGFLVVPPDPSLPGILQSRVIWLYITHRFATLTEREGLLIYRLKRHAMERIPIPRLTEGQRVRLCALTQQLGAAAQQRDNRRRSVIQRIRNDMRRGQGRFPATLAAWWNLSWQTFEDEVLKAFRQEIPPGERETWEALLKEEAAHIAHWTSEIVRMEREVNAIVSAAFELDAGDIQIIEQETRYRFGEW